MVVLLALLYAKLGVGGACAVALGCALIVPPQVLVGKLMSDNSKRIFAAQDARMAKSAETIQVSEALL